MIGSISLIIIIAMAVCGMGCGGSSLSNNPSIMSQPDVLIRAPSVFPAESIDMHKYSAILAATEPFRQICVSQIKKSLNPITRVMKTFMGKSILTQGAEVRKNNIPVDAALTRFEMRVQSIAGSYGMTVDEFNGLTKTLNKESTLKKKIFLQSYFYKIAADLESNIKKVVTLPSLPTFDENSIDREKKYSYAVIDSSLDRDREHKNGRPLLVAPNTPPITRLATALIHIESQRLRLREKIKSVLNIEELPPGIADPSRLPAFAEPIQQANKEFPQLALEIVGDCGFQLEEFMELRQKIMKDSSFRDKVMNEIAKAGGKPIG